MAQSQPSVRRIGETDMTDQTEKKEDWVRISKDKKNWCITTNSSLKFQRHSIESASETPLSPDEELICKLCEEMTRLTKQPLSVDEGYLKDTLYIVTQYLEMPDKEVALLNKRLYDAISTMVPPNPSSVGEIEKIVSLAINRESERNGNKSHRYSDICSCGTCHTVFIVSEALSKMIGDCKND